MYARVLQRPFLFEEVSVGSKKKEKVKPHPERVIDKKGKEEGYEYVPGLFEK